MSRQKMNATPDHPAVRAQQLLVQNNSPELSTEQRRRFGRKFHAERIVAGYTQTQVAAAMGMYGVHAVEFVERLESGSSPEVELTRTRARAIENRLGIPANRLLNEIAGAPDTEPETWPSVGWIGNGPRTAVDARIEALSIIGSVLGALFVIAALIVLVTGHLALAAGLFIIGCICLSFPLALATGRAVETRNRLG